MIRRLAGWAVLSLIPLAFLALAVLAGQLAEMAAGVGIAAVCLLAAWVGVRLLAPEALHACADAWNDAEKRIRDLHAPVQHMGQTWCAECSVRRSMGPKTDEWVAYIPHPCPTLDTLEKKEPTA
jgi:hypothetical protein